MTHETSAEQKDDAIWSRVVESLEAAVDKKASDPVVLDLREASQIGDYFVLLSARSDTQVRAIANEIEQRCKLAGARVLSLEGSQNGQWALLDFGDFVVHVFYEPVRKFYDLERLWARAPRCEIPTALLHPPTSGDAPALPPTR
ncbi:MAG: ribosome silencing factor [Candidatus Binatia bacterium]|nr:ribosome silencing factor [Candidatus Binatia bacterium]